jgi:hypothetical protein
MISTLCLGQRTIAGLSGCPMFCQRVSFSTGTVHTWELSLGTFLCSWRACYRFLRMLCTLDCPYFHRHMNIVHTYTCMLNALILLRRGLSAIIRYDTAFNYILTPGSVFRDSV